MAADILVVDDEADIRELVSGILADEGYAVRTAADSNTALAAIRARRPSLLIQDIWMQGGGLDGLELLDLVKTLDADMPVVMISGHGNIETAVSAIKRGAYDFLEKPFKSDRLLLLVERALESATLKRENKRLRTQAMTPDGLIGKSQSVQQLRQMIAKIASANSRILISGPPGSGKELAARLLHANSAPRQGRVRRRLRRRHDAGADRSGVVRRGGGGRPTPQDRRVRTGRMGGRFSSIRSPTCRARPKDASCGSWWISASAASAAIRRCRVDVRVISSTDKNLRDEIVAGRFREDLFHRLNVVPLARSRLVRAA